MIEFFRTEIAEYLNNVEDEIYSKLTEEEIERVVDNTINNVVNDGELNMVIDETISWYVSKYVYDGDLYEKYKGERV